MVELFTLGLSGVTHDGAQVGIADSFVAALTPLAILTAWLFVAGSLAVRYFRWEPRR